MSNRDELLGRLRESVVENGILEEPLVNQVEPQFRTPTQYAFNPALVERIVEQRLD